MGSKNSKIWTDKWATTKTPALTSDQSHRPVLKMKPYRKAASSTHSGVDSGRVGTKIASRAGKAVLQPLTSFQIAKCGAGEIKNRLHTQQIMMNTLRFTLKLPSILASSLFKWLGWYLICQWGSRWAGRRLRGALLTEKPFRTNQAVFSASVTHLDAVRAQGTRELSAICSSWWCDVTNICYIHTYFYTDGRQSISRWGLFHWERRLFIFIQINFLNTLL